MLCQSKLILVCCSQWILSLTTIRPMATWLKLLTACQIPVTNQCSTFRTGNHTFDSHSWHTLLPIYWDRCHLIRQTRAARSSLKMGFTSRLITSCCLKALSLRRLRPLEAELMPSWSSCSTRRPTQHWQSSRLLRLLQVSSGSLLQRTTTIRLDNLLTLGLTRIPHQWSCQRHSCAAIPQHVSRPRQATSRTTLTSSEVRQKVWLRSRRPVVKLRTAWLDQRNHYTVLQGWRSLQSRH